MAGGRGRIRALALLAAGMALWLTAGRGIRDWNEQLPDLLLPLLLGLACLIPAVRRGVCSAADRTIKLSPFRRPVALLVFILAAVYLAFTAMRQGRYFGPIWHDEYSYLLQASMLAHGRLWMPQHPLADFFDFFQILVRPVYASMYFPGTALLLAPAYWLGLPAWIIPLALAAATVAMTYLLVGELIDDLAGLVAALLLVSSSVFRTLSIMPMSQVPLLLLGLLLVWCFLRWRTSRHNGWALLMGILAGWAAITRPIDALCFALPVALALVLEWRQDLRRPLRPWALLLAGAAPFLLLQLVFNRGVTGHWLETPWTLYARYDHPQLGMGFPRYDPSLRPLSPLLQKQVSYERDCVPWIIAHEPQNVLRTWVSQRLPRLAKSGAPQRLLLILLPAGLLALGGRRWVLAAVLPLFVAFYFCYTLLLEHYCLTIVPAVILLALLGIEALAGAWPGIPRLRALLYLGLAALAIASLPEAQHGLHDQYWQPRMLKAFDAVTRPLAGHPSVVLFRTDLNGNLSEEPVYNSGYLNPDDAPLIRAHDLGPRNIEIFQYYAQRQPQRRFYRFDEKSLRLTYLGTAAQLARNTPPAHP